METMTVKEMAGKVTKDQRYSMRSAQSAYAHAKAFNDTCLAIDLEARKEELASFNYPYGKEHKRAENLPEFCKDPKSDYLIEHSYWDEYFYAVYKRRIKKGWSTKFRLKDAPEHMVTADADSHRLLKIAEDLLIDCCLDTVPQGMRKDLKGARNHWKHRQGLLDIAMSWNTLN